MGGSKSKVMQLSIGIDGKRRAELQLRTPLDEAPPRSSSDPPSPGERGTFEVSSLLSLFSLDVNRKHNLDILIKERGNPARACVMVH